MKKLQNNPSSYVLGQKVFFGLCFLLNILPIFYAKHFVTWDAPCHMYNSLLIKSLLTGECTEFLKKFYFFTQEILPNWMTNIIHIPLLLVLGPNYAEKGFYLVYAFIFAFGLKYFLLQLNREYANVIAGVGLLIMWSKPLWMGFTNNMLSIAFSFWFMAYYIKIIYKSEKYIVNYTMFFLMSLLLYFSHPIGYVFSMTGIFCLFLGLLIMHKKIEIITQIKQHILILLCIMPSLYMLYNFLSKRVSHYEQHAQPFTQKLSDFLHVRTLIGPTSGERNLIQGYGILILILLFIGFYNLAKRKISFNKLHLGFMLWLLVTLIIVFFAPYGLAGGSEIPVRLGFLFLLVSLFFVATTMELQNYKIFVFTLLSCIAVYIGILVERLPVIKQASILAEEVISCEKFIKPCSTVLALNYDYDGKRLNNNKDIANQVWLFVHIASYLGQYKPLVISDNYEANTWYFPLTWKKETNMYLHMDIDGVTFNQMPPRADILGYKQRTGQDIDYVILISPFDKWENHQYTKEIKEQLSKSYTLLYSSEHKRAVLYKRNTL